MSLVYARTPYTLDPGTPLPELTSPAAGLTEDEGEEVLELAAVHDEEMAGPVSLQTSGEDPEIIAAVTIEGDEEVTRVILDWGDGETVDLTDRDPREDTRIVEPDWDSIITAYAVIAGRDYVVSKYRENNEPEPPEVP